MDFLDKNKIKHVDYRDVHILSKFINAHGKVLPRKRTKLSAKHQRQVETAVKRSRIMGFLPFINR